MKQLTLLAATALFAVVLSGCGKTSSSSASTPTTACVWNGSAYVYSGTSNSCNPATSSNLICPANGMYTCAANTQVNMGYSTVMCPSYGYISCTPNQTINGYTNGYTTNTGSGCQQWTQMYGAYYVPVMSSQGLVCVNYQYLISNQQFQQYYPQQQYPQYYNPAQYYNYYNSYYGGGYGYPDTSGFGLSLNFNFGW